MKYILIGTMAVAFYFFFFGSVKWSEVEECNIFKRFFICAFTGFIVSLLFGLPILGIIYLFKIQ